MCVSLSLSLSLPLNLTGLTCVSCCRMDSASDALEALVVAARRQDCLTVGVLESAQLMNV